MRKFCFALAACWLLGPARPAADDIPADVLVQAIARPSGSVFHLAIRLPLSTLRTVQLPTRGPGYLDLAAAPPIIHEAVARSLATTILLFENDRLVSPGRLVATQISLASDRSFASYDAAATHMMGPPLPAETTLVWNQASLDVLLDFPIQSDRASFSLRLPLARLGVRVTTALRLLPPEGPERAFEYQGDPGVVELDPRWYRAAGQFVVLGFRHILSGGDHLLFLCCLVIPFRRFKPLLVIITAFTVAHSITLIASALDLAPTGLWFRPLVESLISLSILYMALENIMGTPSLHRRWRLAFAFGLVHGFGFSFALRESLQFAGSHVIASLLSFNIGVEIGQLLVLTVLIVVLDFLFHRVVAERMGTIVLSAFISHTAWHWTEERIQRLREFSWPEISAVAVATGLRVLMAVLIVVGGLWLWRRLSTRGHQYDATKDAA